MGVGNKLKADYGNDDKKAVEAKFEAQKIAFAPIMFQAAKSLRDLRILEIIHNNRKTGLSIEEIAEELDLRVYGVKVLLEAGLSINLVYVRSEKYFLTKTGWFILNDSMTKVNMDFTNDINYEGFLKLTDSVLTGKPKGLEVFGNWETIYEGLSSLPEKAKKSWFDFDHYYSDIAFPQVMPHLFEDNPKKGMDVGGNTGKFAIKCVEYNDNVNITILDLPQQLEMAEKNIKNKNLQSKIDYFPMNLLDHSKPYPKGYDFIWMSQFLDCFSQEDIVQLIKRAKLALNENGSLFILETYWDKQLFEASTFSLHATSLYFTCLANGKSQMYHHMDMLKLIDKAGMKVSKAVENVGVSHTLYKCVPK